MRAWFRSYWLSLNGSYWFYPALFSILAAVLALTTVYLDRNGWSEWVNGFDWLHPSRPEGARTLLTVIAGSMIGVASTVFSITIAAVAYASGSFGPRLLTNFMEDRGNQLSLATFIATFVYTLLVLRVVRSEDERAASATDAVATSLPGFVPQLSVLTATSFAMISIGVLVFFLHHIPDGIRINTVLMGIGQRLINDIKTRFPEEDDEDAKEPPDQPEGTIVTAAQVGYIKIIDFRELEEIACKHDCTIMLKVRTGDFVHRDSPFIEISGCELNKRLIAAIRRCYEAGNVRTPKQDIEFLFDELVEIALRALSPGVNDPFTAITSMHWLSAAMAELANRNLDRGPEQQNYSRERVIPLNDDFEHFLRRGFGGIRASAAGSPLASKNFIDGLYSASHAAGENRERRKLLHTEGALLLEQARLTLEGPALDELETRFRNFTKSMREQGM